MNLPFHYLTISGLLISSIAYAQVNIIDQEHVFNNQDHFQLNTSGSIRLQALNFEEYNDSNSSQKARRNGYSAASRIYVNADYQMNAKTHLIAGYQTYINPAKILDWDGHYQKSDQSLDTAQLYFGIQDADLGTLKYGQMNSLYYDVVGIKTDLWNYSPLAQPATWSTQSFYDGTEASRKTLRYEKINDHFNWYAAYMFKDQTYPAANENLQYKRQHGFALATDLKITSYLTWSMAWQRTQSDLISLLNDTEKSYTQDIMGTSLFFLKDSWMIGIGAGLYKNIHPNRQLSLNNNQDIDHFLNTESYGLEYYVGYKLPIDQHIIQSIRPYFMGNHFSYTSGGDFYRKDNGLGVAVRFNKGIGFDYEHLFTQDSFNTPNMDLFRLRYEF